MLSAFSKIHNKKHSTIATCSKETKPDCAKLNKIVCTTVPYVIKGVNNNPVSFQSRNHNKSKTLGELLWRQIWKLGIEGLNMLHSQNDSDKVSKWRQVRSRLNPNAPKSDSYYKTVSLCNYFITIKNPTKSTNISVAHLFPTVKGRMNTCRGKSSLYRTLSESGCSSMIIMGRITSKLKMKKRPCYNLVNPSRKIYHEERNIFLKCIPEFSAKKVLQ